MMMMLESMGFIRYPMMFSIAAMAALTFWTGSKLVRPGAVADLRTKAWMDGILFWGGFTFLAGILGTLGGFILAAQSIEAAGEVSTMLLWGGIKVALLSSAFGALAFGASTLVWFGLNMRWRLLRAEVFHAAEGV